MGNKFRVCCFFMASIFISKWPRASPISCHPSSVLERTQERDDRVTTHRIWHLLPFAMKGEAGLKSLPFLWWRAQNVVFFFFFNNNRPGIHCEERLFLPARLLRECRKHSKNEKLIKAKNESSQTLNILRKCPKVKNWEWRTGLLFYYLCSHSKCFESQVWKTGEASECA